MKTVGFTAADIAAKKAKTDPAVKIGRAAIDDINRINEENSGESAAPPEKPKGGRQRKAKEKPETVSPDETDGENGGADEEPVTGENGETDDADSNS